jgi:hypothetical protein
MNAEQERLAADAKHRQLEALGTLFKRAPVGDSTRRLFTARHFLGFLPT